MTDAGDVIQLKELRSAPTSSSRLRESENLNEFSGEKEISFSVKQDRRWKIATFLFAIVAIGLLAALLFFVLKSSSSSSPTVDTTEELPKCTTQSPAPTTESLTSSSGTVTDTPTTGSTASAGIVSGTQVSTTTSATTASTPAVSTASLARSTATPTVQSSVALLFGQSVGVNVYPESFYSGEIQLQDRSTITVKLNYSDTVPVSLAIYWRKGEMPTHTQYDITRTVNSGSRKRRSAPQSKVELYNEVLSPGKWFLGLYNGDTRPAVFQLVLVQSPPPLPCPNDCSGQGTCLNGTCYCLPQWKGANCSEANCLLAGCSGRGTCQNDGSCLCNAGWMGADCSEVDCIPSDCSGNGACDSGICYCNRYWKGSGCEIKRQQCPGGCSGHGSCDDTFGMCTCDAVWTGPDCNTALCAANCSGRGLCDNGTCMCTSTWTGNLCELRTCPTGCETNGRCDNGTCVCNKGWNGDDCLTDACPSNCNHGNGSCVKTSRGNWGCVCNLEYRGYGCDIGVELACSDGFDNDNDNLVDCDDPDCCNTTSCIADPSCVVLPDPVDIVSNSTANATMSFFDTIEFLFTSGIQQGYDAEAIDKSRISVVKGKVLTRDTSSLVGATVTILNQEDLGYTTTRQDGAFDIAVNGGGSVTLRFARRNFITSQRLTKVGWNEFVYLDDVVLIPVDNKVTEVDLSSTDDKIKVASGSRVVDESGARQGVIMFPPNTEAVVVEMNGTSNTTVEKPRIRITEYTVGPNGVQAMPAELPTFTGYTYAVEMSIDQATVNGTTEVVFNQTLPYYVDNYLGFPVGSAVPIGFYNRTMGEWVSSPNGRVIAVLAINVTDGKKKAVLDVNGEGEPATQKELYDLGISEQELEQLGVMYSANKTLWRVPIRHFTPWDCNWPYGPPPDGCSPFQCRGGGGDGNGDGNGDGDGDDDGNGDDDEPLDEPEPDDEPEDPCAESGSIVISQTQSLGELVGVSGTEMVLLYFSSRMPGYYPTITIPLTRSSVPPSLKKIHLTVDVKGQTHTQTFAPQSNLKYEFTWDRQDGYGRRISGKTSATVKIGYEYGLVYYPVRSEFRQSFNRFSDASISRPIGRRGSTAVFWEERQVEIGGSSGPVEVAALGGWSLNVHHSYDPQSGTLYLGNGKRINFKDRSKGVTTVVGTGSRRPTTCLDCLSPMEGTSASLLAPSTLTTAADGRVYVGDYQLIRSFTPKGNITTIVDFSAHPPRHKYYTAVSPQTGALFISYPDTNQVYRVQAGLLKILTAPLTLNDFGVRDGADVFVGTGVRCHGWELSCGDGGAARDARLMAPKGIAVGPGGTVYLADGKVIRQIASDGIVSNYIGSMEPLGCAPPGCPDEGSTDVSRDQAYFHWPTDIAVKQDDESLLIVDNNVLLEVTRNGRVRLSAGRTPYVRPTLSQVQQAAAQRADDLFVPKKATSVDLNTIHGLAVKRDGTVFFAETNGHNINRIRILTANRRLILLAGKDPGCDCANYRCTPSCFAGDGGPAVASTFFFPTALSLSVQGETLFIADQGNVRVRAVEVSLPQSSASGFYAVPSTDGKEIYTFDVFGRHVSTLWASTGQIVYTFQYDDYTTQRGTEGLLTSVMDAFNNTVAIERDSVGTPTTIVSPFGLLSSLKTDKYGYLSTFTNAEGYTTQFTYNGKHGLLTRKEDPSGLIHSFEYSASGRLVKDTRPDGGYLKLQVERSQAGRLVKTMSKSGRTTTLLTSSVGDRVMQTVTSPSGQKVVNSGYGNGTTFVKYADGSVLWLHEGPHPIWGDQRKIVSQQTMQLPSGLSKSWTTSYTAKMKDKSNPLSATEYGHTVKVNNVDFVTVRHTLQDRSQTTSFPQSSLEAVVTYDQFNQPIMSVTKNGGIAPQYNYYNKDGLRERMTQGKYDVRYEYDSYGRLDRKILSDGGVITYSYDGGELVRNLTTPSGRTYGFDYDPVGSITSIVMPSGAQHRLSKKVTHGRTSDTYSAPGQAFTFVKDFNSEGDLVVTRFPSGLREVRHFVDTGGRVSGFQFDGTVVDFSYGDNTSRVERIIRTEVDNSAPAVSGTVIFGGDGDLLDSVSLSSLSSSIRYGYDGPFISSQTQQSADLNSNTVSTSFYYQLDNRFRVTKRTISVDGTPGTSFDVSYDNGNRPTKLGPFTVSRTKLTEVEMNDGTAQFLLKFDSNNRIMEKTLTIRNSKVFSSTFQYDNGSRIIVKTVQAGRSAAAQVYQYEYDLDGQLTGVRLDGRLMEWYSYDTNGNRIGWQTDGKTNRTATYDVQDRLTGVDSTAYRIDDDGFLVRKGVQEFEYNSKGELVKVRSLSGDVLAQYGYDGLGRRVVAVDSGGKTTRYLYGDVSNSFRITHMHEDGTGLTTLYYDVNGAPMAYERGSNRYYVGTDHLGTPFLLSDSTGKSLKIVRHSAYGVLLFDSNPAQDIPLRFAAGVREAATAHLYFSFRDYDPEIGRWTSRDPSLYSGKQANLYQYVLNDPVNFMDPLGLFCIGGSGKLGIGLGIEFCIDKSGVSLCGNAGVGVGGGVTVDILGEPAETKVELYAEASAGVSVPFADIGVKATASYAPFKPGPCQFELDVVASGNTPIGGVEYSAKDGELKAKAGWFGGGKDKEGGPDQGGGGKGGGKIKAKAEASAGIRGCLGTKF